MTYSVNIFKVYTVRLLYYSLHSTQQLLQAEHDGSSIICDFL